MDNPATILLIEDEDDLRDLTARSLRKPGFEVLEARTGREALGVYQANFDRVDLIITDIVMPEMTGPEVIQDIREKYKEAQIKVLYLSGYSASDLNVDGIDQKSSSFLEKPYTTKLLLSEVRRILALE
jgi:two-component system, cell cycle sensor histidine kinase and response regulator CckA